LTWVRLDDRFRSHPKVLRAGARAAYLWICGLSYCAEQLTDGHIPLEAVPSLVPEFRDSAHLVKRLVEVGLWESRDGEYVVHDYSDWQPPSDEVRARRADVSAKRAEAGKRGAAARWQRNGNGPDDVIGFANGKNWQLPSCGDGKAMAPSPSPSPSPSPEGGSKKIHRSETPEPLALLPDSEVKRSIADDVQAHYVGARQKHNPRSRPGPLVDEDRRRIESLVHSGWSADDLKLAVEGLFLSPHHLGENDRETKYLGLEHALREKNLENFVELARAARPKPGRTVPRPILEQRAREAAGATNGQHTQADVDGLLEGLKDWGKSPFLEDEK